MTGRGATRALPRRESTWRRVALNLGGVGFAIGIAATAPFQRGSLLVVSVAALVVLAVGLSRPRIASATSLTLRAALPWTVIFLCWCAWEVIMYFAGNSPQWPTMSILSNLILDAPAGRFLGGIAWYWGAVWLVRTTAADTDGFSL